MRFKTAKDIGSYVVKARKHHKITQKDLAAASGTGVRFIQDLEKGKPTCQLDKTLTVLSMLGIQLTGILPGLSEAGKEGSSD